MALNKGSWLGFPNIKRTNLKSLILCLLHLGLLKVPGQVQVSIMSTITLHVGLLSGRTVQIETGLDIEVGVFNRRAQRALSVRQARLVHSSGSVLDDAKTIGDCELRNEDFLSLQITPIIICATRALHAAAFAVVLGNGSVVTWGNAACGGGSSAVQGQLKNVRHIQAVMCAFAAILADGSVVTWGTASAVAAHRKID